VRYGSKPLEFAKGKNAIELANEAEVADKDSSLGGKKKYFQCQHLINDNN